MQRLLYTVLCLCSIMVMAGCSKQLNMNTVLGKPNFAGIVTEINEQAILVKVNEDEDAYKSSDLISVSLDVEIPDGLSEYGVGNEVRVYYDGTIAESYPAQVSKVYAITIVNEFKGEGSSFHNGVAVHEDKSIQIVRSIMELDYPSMTVADFNNAIQTVCTDADSNIFEVISDTYDHFAVYDDAGEFIGTVFTDRELEAFMDTTLAYSAQKIFEAPFHLFNVAYMTTPDLTAKELYQLKEQMSFDEWNAFFEEHIAEINTFPAFFYSMEVEIADPNTLLVSERDSRINDARASIVSYFIELDEETVAAETFLDILALELKAMSEKYSDPHITVECRVQELEYDVS